MSKTKVKKHKEVEFQVLNLDEAYAYEGTLLLRGDEMVVDIQDSEGTLYLIVGKPQKHFFEGTNTAGPLAPKVEQGGRAWVLGASREACLLQELTEELD